MKRFAHQVAIQAERLWDRVFRRRRSRPVIDVYRGYTTPDELVVRGRVLTKLRRHVARAGTSRLRNLSGMIGLFATAEMSDVPIRSADHEVRSDEEGYFTLRLPRPLGLEAGWFPVPLHIPGREGSMVEGSMVEGSMVEASVFVAPSDARRLTISDIDDTIMETGAFDLARNLWTSLTGTALTRHVFKDAVELIQVLTSAGRDPVFYVSSSPWNLHHFLTMVFERSRVPLGPMFLRDLGISETQFIKGTHGDHKGQSIDTILRAMPDLPVTLVGDTGQHDAVVYADAVERWPGRIELVVLRQMTDDLSEESQQGIERLKAQDVTLVVERDYARVIESTRSSIA